MYLNKRQFLYRLAASVAASSSTWPSLARAENPASPAWAISTQQLAAALLKPNANAVVSPLSIWTALAMTHAGAQGQTAEEIASALHMPNEGNAFVQSWQSISNLQRRISASTVKLHTANRVWLDTGYNVQPGYLERLNRDFQTSPAWVDFQHQPSASREQINTWVDQQTQGLIPKLFDGNSIDDTTRLVLTQAMYLKAPWAQAFDKSLSKKMPFELSRGRKVSVPMMQQQGHWLAAEVTHQQAQIQIVELPYKHDDLRMVLFVPRIARDLPQAIAWLGKDWVSSLQPQRVNLTLPRWKARQAQSLNQPLQQLGMREAFDAKRANFAGISAQRDVYVSAVQHEACVEVTEEGTEAAAATGVVMVTRAFVELAPPMHIHVNHPFAWAVVDSKNRGVLFAGVVQDPRSAH